MVFENLRNWKWSLWICFPFSGWKLLKGVTKSSANQWDQGMAPHFCCQSDIDSACFAASVMTSMKNICAASCDWFDEVISRELTYTTTVGKRNIVDSKVPNSGRGYVFVSRRVPWAVLRQAPFEFEPGSTWSYNSFHLQIAGAMAASAAGISTQEMLGLRTWWKLWAGNCTLPKQFAPENKAFPKGKWSPNIFQPFIFRGYMLVVGRVLKWHVVSVDWPGCLFFFQMNQSLA